MKTEIITCDRCGRKIEKPIFPYFKAHCSCVIECTDYEPFVYEVQQEKEKLEQAMKFGAARIELMGDMNSRSKSYNICRKCEKAFLIFMQGPNGE